MAKERQEDPIMEAVRARAERSGLTYQQIGERMGYPASAARQCAHQFLKGGDPQISTLRRFAEAMGISILTLLRDEPRK